ncbi:hypothetical protein PBRA_003000 [Plasmodiophora brassicae]|nr:hypothetical protein PBRA_003000 [Plasmodiophora brassicae]
MECQLVQMLHGIQALPQQCIQAVEAKQWAWVINIVLVAIGTVAVVIVLGVIAAYTHHPVIASASPLFCVTICLGAIMLLLSNITSGTLPVSSSSCWSTAWLTTLGFSLMFGALFFKTWRVTQVFSMTSTSKHIISNVDLAVRLAAFMLFNVALLAVWMVIQGTTSPARKVFQAPQQCPSASLTFTLLPYVDQCDYHPAGLYAIGLVMAAVIAWGTMLAYRTRNVPLLLFNESKHIAICMYTVAIVSALAVPTLVAMVGNPTVSLLIRTTATFLLVLACVGSLFIPKFLIMSAYTIAEIKAMDGSTNNQQTRPPSVLGDHKPASTQMRTGAQGNFSSAIRGAASTTGSTA